MYTCECGRREPRHSVRGPRGRLSRSEVRVVPLSHAGRQCGPSTTSLPRGFGVSFRRGWDETVPVREGSWEPTLSGPKTRPGLWARVRRLPTETVRVESPRRDDSLTLGSRTTRGRRAGGGSSPLWDYHCYKTFSSVVGSTIYHCEESLLVGLPPLRVERPAPTRGSDTVLRGTFRLRYNSRVHPQGVSHCATEESVVDRKASGQI